jgi:hypothetical protein
MIFTSKKWEEIFGKKEKEKEKGNVQRKKKL